MKDSTKILGALVLGAAAGAVLGLMFAPSSGNELRKKLRDNTDDLIDELAEKINEGKETLSGLTERLMSKADGMMSKVSDEIEVHKNGDGSRKTNPVTTGNNSL
jgi:gas vesicle protein